MYAAATNNQGGCGGRAVEMNWNHITLDPEPDCVAVCASSIKASGACSEEAGDCYPSITVS